MLTHAHVECDALCAQGSYGVAPYFASKLAAESPVGALFPLLFAALVYPAAGLHPRLSRWGIT